MFWIDNQEIAIIFSQKADGDMLFKKQTLYKTPHNIANNLIKNNRINFYNKHNIIPSRLVNIASIHSTNIKIIKNAKLLGKGAIAKTTRIKNTDALITNIKNSYLMITGADCFPVFFYDNKQKITAAAHCGWRGIIKELPLKVIRTMKKNFNSDYKNITIWLGPGIKSCHFEVQQDVLSLFEKKFKIAIIKKDNRYFIDLPLAIKKSLFLNGIKKQQIIEHPDCTFCLRSQYFSFRRDKPSLVEANAFIIHLKK